MEEITAAVTQYGDLKGTVSIDGHQGSPLAELAKRAGVPGTYHPVGLSLLIHPPGHGGRMQLDVLAVDAETGTNYAGTTGPVSVCSFPVEVTAAELLQLLKRVHIVATERSLAGRSLKIIQDS